MEYYLRVKTEQPPTECQSQCNTRSLISLTPRKFLSLSRFSPSFYDADAKVNLSVTSPKIRTCQISRGKMTHKNTFSGENSKYRNALGSHWF